ncbi:MAG: DegT/DnrJ/EryC1/StrS family aminotransferase [Acidobacteriia bacterium]|nr:DegT/DnrJ/EryC1/StrS family aminotransferase [Terriglobia bacterium]
MADGKIPFLDLVAPHEELKAELCEVFAAALRTGAFVGGAMVEGFERDFTAFCGTQHAVGVSSGTDALRFALVAAGVKKDAIVVTVPNTFIATTEAITQAGAHPDFVDIDERTYNMDPEKLREYLEVQCSVDRSSGELIKRGSGRPVAALVPVHLYGQMADMDPILELAERFNLVVIEDACQAHGAEYYSRREQRWRKAGSMGKAAAFSFYPGKNLGACGEGGAVTTDDGELARKVRMLRDHGQSRKYYHEMEGYNGRLDAIQAGILAAKLKRLPEWNALRREAAARYRRYFAAAGAGELAPFESGRAKAVYHLYVVRVPDRDGLIRHLAEANIGTGIHYPVPLHLQKAYEKLGYRPGDFPMAERVATEIVSLPMFPQLTGDQQVRVVDAVAAVPLERAQDMSFC